MIKIKKLGKKAFIPDAISDLYAYASFVLIILIFFFIFTWKAKITDNQITGEQVEIEATIAALSSKEIPITNRFTYDNLNNVGDAGAASIFLELINVLDTKANPGDRILCIAYGSGLGADVFSILVNDKLELSENAIPHSTYMNNKIYIEYPQYLKLREMIELE